MSRKFIDNKNIEFFDNRNFSFVSVNKNFATI